MQTCKKFTATILAVMLVLSMCITSFSVAAAETSTGTKTISVGVINYVCDAEDEAQFQIHYWNNGGLAGDAKCVALNTTTKKSVGAQYWGGAEQTFNMFTAEIPAEATGYKFHIGTDDNKWFGETDGDATKTNAVYAFNYSGNKALYESTSTQPTTPAPTTATGAATQPATDPVAGTTITVGVINYICDAQDEAQFQVHYWNNGGLSGDAKCVALNTTAKKSVGKEYWGGAEQTFNMFTAVIPADATGYKFHIGTDDNLWFGEDGDATKATTVYVFDYSGNKALYEASTTQSTTTATTPAPTTASGVATQPATQPATDPVAGTTITVGVINYVCDAEDEAQFQIHYWNNGGLSGDAKCVALNTTTKKSVGKEYWNGAEQTFNMFTAVIPADATGYKFHIGTDDNKWFGETDGDATKTNAVYAFNYSGNKAIYESTTTVQPTTSATTPVASGATAAATTAVVTPASTVKFTNNQNWSSVYAYFWNDTQLDLGGVWPGVAMTKYETNEYGSDNYTVNIPAGATKVIFNDGKKEGAAQTVDVTLSGKVGYYTDGTQTDGKYNVFAWADVVPGTTSATPQPTLAPGKGITITVGVINYVCDAEDEAQFQIHYWNNGGLSGDAKCVALNTTTKKSVGKEYWDGAEQTFNMFTAVIPADATGYKFHIGTADDKWFGETDGDATKTNAVYAFNYSGNKAIYETVVVPTTPATTAAPTTPATTAAPTTPATTAAPTTPATTAAPTTPATTAAPTTQPATTEPVTTVPPTEPADFSTYAVKGDITAAMKTGAEANTVTTTLDLAAGQYKFIVQNTTTNVKYGRKDSAVDSMSKKMFGANWGYFSFMATGGTYTFTYNTKSNVLSITCDRSKTSTFSSMKLKGHVSSAMVAEEGSSVIKTTVDLPVGVYNFGIADGDNFYGRMTTYVDAMPKSIVGNRWGFCKLSVTKTGTFEFIYDTATKYMMVVPKSANASDYNVTGDLALNLAKTDDENVVESVVKLDKGSYSFKIANSTATFGRKATYTDSITNAQFGTGWDSCTLVATGGTYKFTYNTKTNKLTVAMV